MLHHIYCAAADVTTNKYKKLAMQHRGPKRTAASSRQTPDLSKDNPMISIAKREAKTRQKMVERIGRQLNQVWYHLYKFMGDIQSRRIAVCNPKAREESEMLTKYATRALSLMSAKNNIETDQPLQEDTKAPSLATLEGEAKKMDSDLCKVIFADQHEQDVVKETESPTQNVHAAKYRKWVLDACGIPDTIDGKPRGRKVRTHLRSCGNMAKLLQFRSQLRALNATPAKDPSADSKPTILGPIKEAQKKSRLSKASTEKRLVSEFDANPKLEDIKPGALFHPGLFVTSTDLSQLQPKQQTLSQLMSLTSGRSMSELGVGRGKQKKTVAKLLENKDEDSPYFTESANKDKHQEPGPAEIRLKAIRESKERLMRCIYGKRVSDSPAFKERIVRTKSKELYQHLLKMQKTTLSRPAPLSPFTRNVGAKLYYKTMQPGSKDTTLGTPNKTHTDFSYGHSIRLFPAVPGPASVAVSNNHTKINLRRESESKAATSIVKNCLEARDSTEQSISAIDCVHRRICTDLIALKTLLQTQEGSLENASEVKNQVRCLTERKHLFIYGKKGLGRFLSSKGKDMIKISDVMMNMNPKYPFMSEKLSHVLAKGSLQYVFLYWNFYSSLLGEYARYQTNNYYTYINLGGNECHNTQI